MNRRRALLLFVLAAQPSLGQAPPPGLTGQFTVQTKSTAAEQLAYANRLRHELLSVPTRTPQRIESAAQAAAAYDVVITHWPNDVPATGRACIEKAELFVGESMYRNAESTCDSVAERLAGTREEAELLATKARAFLRERNYDAAERVFRATEQHRQFAQLPAGWRFATYNEFAFLHELTGKPAEAARYLRKAAAVEGVSLLNKAGALLGVIEMSEHASDRATARSALREFDEALTAASRTSLPPADIEGLHSLETESKRWHKKLGD
jgi:tetratricopeptide (TPR) repeat protein